MAPLLSTHCKIETQKSSCNRLSFFHNNKQMRSGGTEDVKSLHEKIDVHEHAAKEKTTNHREH
jgi:ABC-type multidrug transport system ATPase subunit